MLPSFIDTARDYLGRQLKDRPSVRGEAALIDLTLARGARDNVTVVIVRCRDMQAAHHGTVPGDMGQRVAPDRDEWHVEG
mgnify:CR=1 FL=1